MTTSGRVVVVGSLNVDLVARVDRLPREGETLTGAELVRTPGGKGLNQAVAAARAGATVELVGAVGDDESGAWLRRVAAAEGVGTDALAVVEQPTGTALITVGADGANTIVVAPGANHEATAAAVVEGGGAAVSRGDVVLCQAEVPGGAVTAALRAARAAGATTVLNQAPFRPPSVEQWAALDVLVVNELELGGVLGAFDLDGAGGPAAVAAAPGPGAARAAAEIAGRRLLQDRPGPGVVVVTLGAAGAVAVRADGSAHLALAPAVDAIDTVGAGDCLTGWLAAGLAAGRGSADALDRAVRAASLAVQRPGAAEAMPLASEVPDPHAPD